MRTSHVTMLSIWSNIHTWLYVCLHGLCLFRFVAVCLSLCLLSWCTYRSQLLIRQSCTVNINSVYSVSPTAKFICHCRQVLAIFRNFRSHYNHKNKTLQLKHMLLNVPPSLPPSTPPSLPSSGSTSCHGAGCSGGGHWPAGRPDLLCQQLCPPHGGVDGASQCTWLGSYGQWGLLCQHHYHSDGRGGAQGFVHLRCLQRCRQCHDGGNSLCCGWVSCDREGGEGGGLVEQASNLQLWWPERGCGFMMPSLVSWRVQPLQISCSSRW